MASVNALARELVFKVVYYGPGGETILTLISDDNFNHFLQRTVLLQFALRNEGVSEAPPSRT